MSTKRVIPMLLVVATTVIVLASTLTASALPRVAAAAKPVKGGTLTIGVANEAGTMDPVKLTLYGTTTGTDRAFLVYGSLLNINSKTGQMLPGLAQSLTSPDGQIWTLKLRPNLKFSDGTPLDADAVIFNFERFLDPASAFVSRSAVVQISKMTRIDPTTVEFKLTQPNGSFPIPFSDVVGMMASPTAVKADPRGWGQRPVGAGAYLMKEWVRDQQMTFVRNPNYYDAPRPYIDTIVFKLIPSRATLSTALKLGDVDVVHSAEPTTDLQVALADRKTFRPYEPSQISGATGMTCNLEKPPCDDIRFRRALAMSFDYESAKQVNLATIPISEKRFQCPPFGPGSPYCAKDVWARYNPKKARQLFDEVRADGISPDFVYTWNSQSAAGPASGEWVQQSLAKVGVKVTIRPVTTPEIGPITTAGSFQTAIASHSPSVDPTARYYNDWHSVGGPNGGRDIARLNNAELDVALEKGQKSLKLEDRIAGIQEAQRIIDKNAFVVWHFPLLLGVVSRRTLQLPQYVNPNARDYRYEEAWIKRER